MLLHLAQTVRRVPDFTARAAEALGPLRQQTLAAAFPNMLALSKAVIFSQPSGFGDHLPILIIRARDEIRPREASHEDNAKLLLSFVSRYIDRMTILQCRIIAPCQTCLVMNDEHHGLEPSRLPEAVS